MPNAEIRVGGNMLDRPNSSPDTTAPIKGKRPPPGSLDLAKWPPDDADVPAAPGGGMPAAPAGGGGGDVGDGDFRKGKTSGLVFALLGVLTIAGVGAGVYFGMKEGHTKMTLEQLVKEKKNIFVLPKKDQAPLWRKWAADPNEWALQQEALIQLAYADDPEGVTFATNAIPNGNHQVRGVCAQVLAYYGSPRADGAKTALLAALKEADNSDKPQIVWALIALKEPAVFKDAMDQYRKGFLSKVERLGGGAAFDPEKLAALVPLDEFQKLAGDESPSVRQLVATLLSRDAQPKWTQTLIQLVKDKDVEVAREAATGLGKIGDETARAPLLAALSPPAGVDPQKDQAFKDNRQKFLEALRDGIGGEGLVLALDSVKPDPPETEWFQTKQLMDMIKDIADPRTGNALVKWVEAKKPSVHWQGEVGTRLSEIGDIRAAKILGERMRFAPADVYKLENFWQAGKGGHLSRGDESRVVGSRMLADLAILHRDNKAALAELKTAEEGVLFWIKNLGPKEHPQPHANGLRFLAAINSEKALNDMRDWAFPTTPLPKEGAPAPFPTEFETAQSALRYIGMMKDEQSFPKLLSQFKRKKDKKMDTTLEGMNGGGIAMLGMALRAVTYGAAQGLAQWGDGRGNKDLMEFIEDELWNEEARLAACDALAWCADDKTMIEVAKKAAEFGAKKEPRKQVIGACYAQTLSLKPMPGIASTLAELIKPELDISLRMYYARAIGIAGMDEETQKILWEKLQVAEIRNAAALALIMGGSAETAARTVALYGDFGKDALNDLADHYERAFGYWSDEDFKRGNLYRYVANAEAIARIKVGDATQDWSRQRLQKQFNNLEFDNGPHSETRVVLRYRLWQDAKGTDIERKKGAIMTLKFMKERGVLMALRQEQGDTGDLAKRAFFELMNPKMVIVEESKTPPSKGASKGDKQ